MSHSFAFSFIHLTPDRSALHCAPKPEYCKAHGYPPPRFLDALDDSGDAAAAQLGPGVRHKVWVVLGSERFELPTSYAGINEGEEKIARKVLHHLRSRDLGEVKQE